jgi:pyruvate dehydrogenase (quinone)
MASFVAWARAEFTDEVGMGMATSGPGSIHSLNGLYEANLDHQPVVAIVGQTHVRPRKPLWRSSATSCPRKAE